MSQTELAGHVGAYPKDISDYERGIKAPRWERLEAIADALSVDVEELVRKNGHPVAFLPEAVEAARIIERLYKNDPQIAAQALKVLRSFLKD